MQPAHPPLFATPDEVEQAFYDALEQGNLDLLMQTWADDEEIVCIHPGGSRLVGLHAVKASWRAILDNGPVPIRPMRVHTLQSMMSSVHTLIEQWTVPTREGLRTVQGYATHVFHKGPTGWHLVLHHASPAPHDAGLVSVHDIPDLLH